MKKPSEIKVVKAKKAHFLLPTFKAITWFGIIRCQSKSDVELINKTDTIDGKLKCHETIHVRQAESKKNSWLRFYLAYLWQWICNLPLMTINIYFPYKFIPFELEAYANEENYTYPTNGPLTQWKKFKKLTLKEKRKFAKQHKKEYLARFPNFIRKNIIPYIENK